MPYKVSMPKNEYRRYYNQRINIKLKKVKVTLQQATKAQRGSRGIALLFL
jgi:hypothetical protein